MPASVWPAAGQQHAVAALRGAVARGEVGHAWAFLGPPGVGQQELARGLAAALNCVADERTPEEPCGTCDVCDRSRRGVHPAYWEFVPAGAMHRVADVREEWLPAATRSAVEGQFKVLRIVDADRMNDAAANAFLKGLEEPPQGTIWILDVSDPVELPDTILSRCRALPLNPWGRDELAAEADALGLDHPEERELAVRAALGSPLALQRLAAEGGLDDLRAVRSIPTGLREGGSGYALVAAGIIDAVIKRRVTAIAAADTAERDELAALYGNELPRAIAKQLDERRARREREAKTVAAQAALDDLVGWYRDCLVVGADGDPSGLIHTDALKELSEDAQVLGAERILRAVDLVLATREQLELNVQQALTLEALFLELAALSITPVPSAR